MISRREEMTEKIGELPKEELCERLITAEHLIYVLEAILKDTTGVHAGVDLLFGNDLHRLVEDEKNARAAYAAARETK